MRKAIKAAIRGVFSTKVAYILVQRRFAMGIVLTYQIALQLASMVTAGSAQALKWLDGDRKISATLSAGFGQKPIY